MNKYAYKTIERLNLIPDWECDRVLLILPTPFMEYYERDLTELQLFYADLLEEIAKYDRVICIVSDRSHADKMMQLTNLSEDVFPIAYVKDIWVRDFAPIQSKSNYLKLKYNPTYDSQIDNEDIERSFLGFFKDFEINNLELIDLCLEGGNFIHNGKGTAIITDKIYQQNQQKNARQIEDLIKNKLAIEKLVIVPTEPDEPTGHIDGMMRWLDSERLLINNYQNLYPNTNFYEELNSCLARQLPDVARVILPYLPVDKKYEDWESAEGNYINYLRTKNRVYVPVFNNSLEPEIKQIYKQIFNNKVSFIDSNAVAKYGGLLNCLSWNYKYQLIDS